MSDFWYSMAVSAYESANAWRTQAVASSLPVSDLTPLGSYNNYQKAIADYRAAESVYLNALIDNGGIGGGGDFVEPTRAINTGTGLTGGGDLSADRTISLANTAVTPASYGSSIQTPSITIDAQGRITAASNNTITPSNIGAVPTTRDVSTGTGLSGGGNLSADRTISLANTAVTPGTYGSATQSSSLTVDAQGRITAASQALHNVAYANITGYDSGIQTFSFASGWENFGATYLPSYRKNGIWVALRGLVKRTTTSGNTICTLPVGYRPYQASVGTVAMQIVNGNPREMAYINIDTAGVVLLLQPSPASTIHWLSLDGVMFHVN